MNGEDDEVWQAFEAARAAAAARGDAELVETLARLAASVGGFEERVERFAGLGRLAAGVVHELNNPLTVVTMYTEMMLDEARLGGPLAGEADKLKAIAEAAQRVQRFMRDLTSYARPGADRREPLDLGELVEKAARLCKPALKEADASVVTRVTPAPAIAGNRASLEQVLVNLITNAAEAIHGGGTITVSVAGEAGGAVIRVEDTGGGMTAEVAAHCLEPFYTTQPGGKGTGLGLPIAAGIVRRHGGELTFSSTPGKGSIFTVRLPAAG
ncbi:MAG TPA: HAMP domain-containing sensor histidine kinase [Anaeromyxobacteraceae bacterium]|nr:HAMP domain-containing sensor histidine kinase [Anaeromyxobacteraceae bacterium]